MADTTELSRHNHNDISSIKTEIITPVKVFLYLTCS